jgi:ankyrin repeat protein
MVDVKDSNGWTPLLAAALNGQEEIVEYLVVREAGAKGESLLCCCW